MLLTTVTEATCYDFWILGNHLTGNNGKPGKVKEFYIAQRMVIVYVTNDVDIQTSCYSTGNRGT